MNNINEHTNYPDSNIELEIPALNISPLKKICMTIGELPTSYLETMTYYEMLIWFIQFLNNTVIPTVNNNSEALQEVQNAVINLQTYINNYKDVIDSNIEDLEDYMNNYFDNLDVQEEIDNKLDEMVDAGTLQEIIADYLNSKAVFGYDTVYDMSNATNLIDGSYARTLGYYQINDGGGALYKIVDDDTLTDDGGFVHELENGLFATLIIENTITPEQFGAYGDGVHDDTNAFISAINSHYDIIGTEEKIYKLNSIETTNDISISISNCNFYCDAFESNTDVKFLFRTYSTNVNFDNCSFTSSFDYTPVINILNNLNQGQASNVVALRAEHGCKITNCKFNSIYGIDSRGKTIVDNCLFDNVEMGILGNTNDNILITNCTFNMNKLVNSQYYHALYIQGANSFIANNIFIKEVNEGQCGDHLHFKNPSITTTTTPKAVISNCIISGDLSFPYLVQNNSAKLEINNLTYNGDINGAFQTTDSGNITINNSNIKCNGTILFNCYGNIKVNNSIFNCTNNSLQLATRCNTELNDTSIISTGTINMNRDIGSLTNNMFNCKIKANSINSLNCGGNGIVNNIMNCLYELTTGDLNLSGRGFINAIIRNNASPSAMGTVSDHNSYSLVVYQSNTYFKKIESLLS